MKQSIIAMSFLMILGTACTKQTTLPWESPALTTSPQTSSITDSGTTQSGSRDYTTLPMSIATTGGAVCSYTPVAGTWNINTAYSNQYVHFYQIDAKPDYPGGVLCGPTSYMLAAHMICAAKNHPYPSSKAKVGAIYNALCAANKFDNTQGMYMSDLDWFNSTYDDPVVKTNIRRTLDRNNMKEFIEYHIKSGFPVIVTVDVYGTKGSSWTNDGAMADQSGTQYYISKNASDGHYIVLTGIKVNADGSGTIWYKDPLSSTGATRSASYTRILDAMKSNGNPNYYDAIAVYE
jgi:hypothetical protein